MKPLTKDQIKSIVEWMTQWESLNGTVIPLRFIEDFSDKTVKENIKNDS
jgi:hypothetical protein